MTALIIASIVLATIAAVVGWWFVWLYAKEPWQDSEAGRHLMHFTAGMSVIMTWSVLGIIIRLIFGEHPWFETALAVGRTIIFGWAAYMLIQRTRLLRKAIRARLEQLKDKVTSDD